MKTNIFHTLQNNFIYKLVSFQPNAYCCTRLQLNLQSTLCTNLKYCTKLSTKTWRIKSVLHINEAFLKYLAKMSSIKKNWICAANKFFFYCKNDIKKVEGWNKCITYFDIFWKDLQMVQKNKCLFFN